VDTTRDVTPEDKGFIHIASGTVRRGPGAWADLAFLIAPMLIAAIWLGRHLWLKRRKE
jgi:hypothetical protein